MSGCAVAFFHSSNRRTYWFQSSCAPPSGSTRSAMQISEKSRNKSRCQLIMDICRLSASRMLVASLTWLLQRYWSNPNTITTPTARRIMPVVKARSLISNFILWRGVPIVEVQSESEAQHQVYTPTGDQPQTHAAGVQRRSALNRDGQMPLARFPGASFQTAPAGAGTNSAMRNLSCSAWLRFEFISESLHGEYKFWLFRIFFQFLTQAGHVHVHGARIHVRAVSPYLLQQFFARKCCAAVLDEISKKLKFARRQVHNLSVPGRFGSQKVHMNGPEIKPARLRHGPARRAPEERFDAGHKLQHVERLRDVIIGADFQSIDLVTRLPASRQHQNRSNEAGLADVTAHDEPAFARQHDIQNNQIKRNLSRLLETFIAISRAFHRVSFVSQAIAHGHAQRLFIFHKQHVSAHDVSPQSFRKLSLRPRRPPRPPRTGASHYMRPAPFRALTSRSPVALQTCLALFWSDPGGARTRSFSGCRRFVFL